MERRGDWSQAQTLVEAAQPLISARAVYKVCYIEARLEDAIVIDGIRLKSKVLRKNLDNVGRVFPYVVTIGDKPEEKARACDDLLKQYYLDTIGNVALVTARRYIEDLFRFRYALGGMSYMSPGSLEDWPIEEQGPLFSILGDVEASIGVRLKKSLRKFHFIVVNSARERAVHQEGPATMKGWPENMGFWDSGPPILSPASSFIASP